MTSQSLIRGRSESGGILRGKRKCQGGGKGTPAYAAKSSLGPVVSSATECQNGFWLEFFLLCRSQTSS